MVSQPGKTTLSCVYFMSVKILRPRPRAFLTSRYLIFIPLGREYTPTLRIKVGTVGRATPVREPATRVVVDVSVAHEVRLAVQRLEEVDLDEGSARILAEHTWMVPVTVTLGSSRQSVVVLGSRSGSGPLRTHLGQCDRRLGYARYRAHLR